MMDLVRPFIYHNPFAETVIYTPGGGNPESIRGIFDDAFALSNFNGIDYQNSDPQFHCATEDVDDADDSATIIRQGVTYYVMQVKPDGTGISLLILSTQQPA